MCSAIPVAILDQDAPTAILDVHAVPPSDIQLGFGVGRLDINIRQGNGPRITDDVHPKIGRAMIADIAQFNPGTSSDDIVPPKMPVHNVGNNELGGVVVKGMLKPRPHAHTGGGTAFGVLPDLQSQLTLVTDPCHFLDINVVSMA